MCREYSENTNMKLIRKVVTSIQRAFRKIPKNLADKLFAYAIFDLVKRLCGHLYDLMLEVISALF
jgi:hypothetical protein